MSLVNGDNIFLRRLELSGFKSFANKTVLEFVSGIAAIVGPNGSGKSNIVDAIRWAMGEREASRLRSAKMENLIFAGTSKRAAVGLAHVSLYFDNQSKIFPLDFEEIVISRKADRSGLSEYYVNQSEVRLKELSHFLAQARLGSKGLLIINQGDSDILIKSSPSERRAMIEEAIGLRQYQLKKNEAEKKLELTSVNLDKARAMAEEIKPHLRFLRRQTNRYEKRSEVAKELEESENIFFSRKLQELESENNRINPRLKLLEPELSKHFEKSEKLEKELKEKEEFQPRQNDLAAIRADNQKIRLEQSRIQKELGRLEGRLEGLIGEPRAPADFSAISALKLIQEVKARLSDCLNENELAAIKSIIKSLLAEMEKINFKFSSEEEIALLNKEKEKLLAEFAVFEKLIKELLAKETFLIGELEGFSAVFRKTYEALEQSRSVFNRLNNEKNQLLLEKDKIEFRRRELVHQAAEQGKNIDEAQNIKYEIQNEGAEINLSDLERKIFKLRGELAAIGEIDETGFKEARETEDRYNFLTNQISDLEKALADLRILIKDLKTKIDHDFRFSLNAFNEEFNKYCRLMFGGGKASFKIQKSLKEKIISQSESENKFSAEIKNKEENQISPDNVLNGEEKEENGLEIDLVLPKKKIHGLASLSGGERSLVSLAALFALIAIKPPPFLVLDEIDAALDEMNAKRFSGLLKEFSHKTQFLIITHNRSTMEAADILYGITMSDDGVSKAFSLKLES